MHGRSTEENPECGPGGQARRHGPKGTLADYRLYALLAPHLANCGRENTGWVGEYKGTPTLYAHRESIALATTLDAIRAELGVVYPGE